MLVAFTGWTFLGFGNLHLHTSIAILSLAILESLAAYYGFRVAAQPTIDIRLQSVWRWIGFALSAIALSGWVSFVGRLFNISFLSELVDWIYFVYYPCIMVALFKFPFSSSRGTERRIFWLDIAIIITATFMAFWAVNLYLFIDLFRSQPSALLVLVFPLGDAFLFAGVTALLQRNVEQVGHQSLIFLTIALGMNALGEGFYDFASIHVNEIAISYTYILWLLGAFFFLIAAVVQINQEPPGRHLYPSRRRSILRMILPYLGVLAGWGTLIIMTFTSVQTDLRQQGVLLGALVLVVLVLWRQYSLLAENTHLYDEMQRLAMTDSLTGLYNRHYFNEMLKRELLRAERYRNPLALLLGDVDDFKFFNDTLGHLKGDLVLKIVSQTMNMQLRKVDLLSRFGGDEFAVIMPDTDQAGAETAASRIQAAVGKQSYADKQLGLSIGVAVFRPGMTPEQLVEQADNELYRKKSSKYARRPDDSA